MINSILEGGSGYYQYFSTASVSSTVSASDLQLGCGSFLVCQRTALKVLYQLLDPAGLLPTPAVQQLLSSPASAQGIVVQLVGDCMLLHSSQQKKKQKRQMQRDLSNSNSSKAVASPCAGGLSCLSGLVVPPDHTLITVPGGAAAAAIYSWMPFDKGGPAEALGRMGICFALLEQVCPPTAVQLQQLAAADSTSSTSVPGPLSEDLQPLEDLYAHSGVAGTSSTLSSAMHLQHYLAAARARTASAGSILNADAALLQLLLEAIVLAGAHTEENGSTVSCVGLQVLSAVLGCVAEEERSQFVKTRGKLLLEALALMVKTLGLEQQQDQQVVLVGGVAPQLFITRAIVAVRFCTAGGLQGGECCEYIHA